MVKIGIHKYALIQYIDSNLWYEFIGISYYLLEDWLEECRKEPLIKCESRMFCLNKQTIKFLIENCLKW